MIEYIERAHKAQLPWLEIQRKREQGRKISNQIHPEQMSIEEERMSSKVNSKYRFADSKNERPETNFPLPKDGKALCLGCGHRGDGMANIKHSIHCPLRGGKK